MLAKKLYAILKYTQLANYKPPLNSSNTDERIAT
jgi:hypothetical protein